MGHAVRADCHTARVKSADLRRGEGAGVADPVGDDKEFGIESPVKQCGMRDRVVGFVRVVEGETDLARVGDHSVKNAFELGD